MLQTPFPYFGGKATIAVDVWKALGQPRHYIEPFFGSGAVLLNRPNYDPTKHVETINDKDGFICNIWRSLQFSPDEVAKWCDWPINHADLNARRKTLIANEDRLLENLVTDDKWHDPVMAGYWIWAASCWIASGLTRPNAIPHISDGGTEVHKIGKMPHLSDAGMGVQDPYNTNIYIWFRKLSERLRNVRVVCGDWKQVCGGNWQDKLGPVGIFFDPPYGVTDRDTTVYHHDSTDIAAEVMAWCLERGSKKTYRIVLCGYEEYEGLLSHGWTAKNWKALGGYANISRDGKQDNQGEINRHREVIYFSPHCARYGLFDND